MTEHPENPDPLPSLSASELLNLVRARKGEAADPVEQANEIRAANELASIYSLKNNPDFTWFMRTFLQPAYQKQFDALRSPTTSNLTEVQSAYHALRDVLTGMLNSEIVHRTLLNPNDEEIPRLTRQMEAL